MLSRDREIEILRYDANVGTASLGDRWNSFLSAIDISSKKIVFAIFDRNIIIRNDTIQIYHNNLSMNRKLICTSKRMFF